MDVEEERLLLRNMTDFTGGPNGISNIEKPTFFGLTFERKARYPQP